MIDAILYVPDFPSLVYYLKENHPDMLAQDEIGDTAQPPVVTGFSRTSAQVSGDRVMIYARLRKHEAEQWRGMPHVQVLAESPFVGHGTAQAVYDQVFSDPELLAIYDSVYDRSPREVNDPDGSTHTITPPDWFGIMAGA